jgi:hypothetical protein
MGQPANRRNLPLTVPVLAALLVPGGVTLAILGRRQN